ncbi:universal stress protein [Streptomyces griseocarneus]|uniref:universal stress protein n=1 Tax=Streptomyces griseocarneus TaxID=51201 RepID=UPI00167E9D55|nr:universal stress protein [Streptomyces griseocarneus]MBZ6474281.1 universal stress protein [Streptomyces griseocarneus]GHG53064.1 universal stress protein [Streptomyces griseocarneus]
MEPAPITAGLDGSAESLAAAHWAAAEAARRGLALRLLHAWILHVPEPADVPPERDRDYWAKRIVHAAHAEVRARFPALDVTEDIVADEPGAALLKAAEASAMVVLGSRGLDRLESFFLGDVGLHVAGRAERPVVLVRTGMGSRPRHPAPAASPTGSSAGSPAGGGGVVLGLGLRRPAHDLLDFAFDAAAARGVPLRVLHGRPLPVQAYAPWGVDPEVAQEITEHAELEVAQALRPWRERHPDVTVIDAVSLESPAKAVVRAAGGADLLVVGRRRHRPALVPRLSAVAQACVHHAPCPVVVVPHD